MPEQATTLRFPFRIGGAIDHAAIAELATAELAVAEAERRPLESRIATYGPDRESNLYDSCARRRLAFDCVIEDAASVLIGHLPKKRSPMAGCPGAVARDGPVKVGRAVDASEVGRDLHGELASEHVAGNRSDATSNAAVAARPMAGELAGGA